MLAYYSLKEEPGNYWFDSSSSSRNLLNRMSSTIYNDVNWKADMTAKVGFSEANAPSESIINPNSYLN